MSSSAAYSSGPRAQRLVYKAKSGAAPHPDLFMVTEPGMVQQYRDQKTRRAMTNTDGVPHPGEVTLTDVVQSFDIFSVQTGRGFEGKAGHVSNTDLAAIFGTESKTECVERIILEGEVA